VSLASTLWPARLHHLRRDSPDPERLARFYANLLGDAADLVAEEQWLVHGPGRALVVGKGVAAAVPYFALEMQDDRHLGAYAGVLDDAGIVRTPCAPPLFERGAFAITDPDGRQIVFGVSRPRFSGDGARGRLQHFVCATTRLAELLAFYRDRLGMLESDRVLEGEALSACFLRSDPEHHSFAAFRAPEGRADHHCYETDGWLDIRDWADRMGRLGIPLWWGPGRHGPGNNLFFMVEDPEGHKVEFSAELELMPPGMAHRTWPHEQRTLNLWGSAWMRS
jgi:catechol 2,3-dioxygenase-like lactoylglutathione lyase family enzyme